MIEAMYRRKRSGWKAANFFSTLRMGLESRFDLWVCLAKNEQEIYLGDDE